MEAGEGVLKTGGGSLGREGKDGEEGGERIRGICTLTLAWLACLRAGPHERRALGAPAGRVLVTARERAAADGAAGGGRGTGGGVLSRRETSRQARRL